MGGRPWKEEEIARLRELVEQGHRVPHVASVLGRTNASVAHRLNEYGWSADRCRIATLETVVVEMHAQQRTDREIAHEFTRRTGHRISGEQIGNTRRRLGLPSNAFASRQREQIAKRYRQLCDRIGVRSLGEVGARNRREFAINMGWPADLRPRQVLMLTALYERGPMTRKELLAASGQRCGSNNMLNGGTTSYLGDLEQRGLVVRLSKRTRPGTKGFISTLYAIPLNIRRFANGQS